MKTNVFQDRWSDGVPHHPRSEQLMRRLMAVDWHVFHDYFCWKIGGDGDNAETLMYAMDVVFEAEDNGELAELDTALAGTELTKVEND